MALTLPAVALTNEPSPAAAELLALITTYEATGTATDAAKAAWRAAGKQLGDDLSAADLSIRFGHEIHHERIELDHERTPEWVREHMIRKRCDERLASMRRSKARQPELAPWLGNIPA